MLTLMKMAVASLISGVLFPFGLQAMPDLEPIGPPVTVPSSYINAVGQWQTSWGLGLLSPLPRSVQEAKMGLMSTLTMGYALGPLPFRVDLMASYAQQRERTPYLAATFSGLMDVAYEWRHIASFVPYVAVGGGWGRYATLNTSHDRWVGQIQGGASYYFSKHWGMSYALSWVASGFNRRALSFVANELAVTVRMDT